MSAIKKSAGFRRWLTGVVTLSMVMSLLPAPGLAWAVEEMTGQDEVADVIVEGGEASEQEVVTEDAAGEAVDDTGIVVDGDVTVTENEDGSVTYSVEGSDAAEGDQEAVTDEGTDEVPVVEDQAVVEDQQVADNQAAVEDQGAVEDQSTTPAEDEQIDVVEEEEVIETVSTPAMNGVVDNPEEAIAQIGETYYDSLASAIESAEPGATIKLLDDINDEDNKIEAMSSVDSRYHFWIDKSITIDGDEHTIWVNGRGIGIKGTADNYVDVTIKNVYIENIGTADGRCVDTRGNLNSLTLDGVTLSTAGSTFSGYLQPLTIGGNQLEKATVHILRSEIITNSDANKGYAITTFNPVDMTITDGTIKGWACLNLKGADGSAGTAGSTISVDNTNLISANGTPGESNAYSLIKIEDDNISVSIKNAGIEVDGGENTQSIVAFQTPELSNCTVTLGEGNKVALSGDYKFQVNAGENSGLVITGGSFNVEVPADCIPQGYKLVDNGDGWYSVAEEQVDCVAQIGETGYETLDSAFAAVKAGDTLEILKAGEYTLPSIPNITIKGNVDGVVFNHTGTGNVAGVTDGATFKNVTFNFGNNNYHGFQHAGTINMESCTLNGRFSSYGDMNFTGCTFNAPGTEASGINNEDYSMWAYAGNLTYTGCTFNGVGKFLNVYNESGATRYTVEASGCTFNNSGAAKKAAFNVKETCGSKVLQYTVSLSNCTTTGNFPKPSGSATDGLNIISGLVQVDDRKIGGTDNGGEIVVNVDGEQVYITPAVARVAAIGDVQYKTLQAALDAAHEMTGDVTVTLVADVTEVAVVHQKEGLNLTVDGGGKTITGQLYVDGDGRYEGADTLTIKDAKFAYDAATYFDAFIDVPNTKTTGKPYTTGKYNYAHNVTVSGCEFAGEGTTTVAVRVASGAGANKVALANNEATGGHSFAQLVGVKDLTIEGNEVSGVKNGINISGGDGTATISGNTLAADAAEGYAVRFKDANGSTAALTDNTFSGGEGIVNASTGASVTTIASGKYTGPLTTSNNGKIVVTGGLFSIAPALAVCGDGLYPIANTDEETKADYPYTVGQAVAAVEGLGYLSFAEAATAAGEEKVITLLADIVDEYLLESGTLKVAHNGKALTVKAPEGSVLKSSTADGVTTYKVGAAVASITKDGTTTTYGWLEDAFADAQSGDTVDVFAGVVELPATATIPEGVTVKGAGKDETTLKITTSNGDGIKITNPNVTIQDAAIDGSAITSGGYKSLVNVKADGCVIDNVVMTGGGTSTWNSSILVERLTAEQTFTVKNSTISGSFRGVLRESCSGNIVVNNCEIDAIYPINIDGGAGGTVNVSDSKLHGWTSYSGIEKATFNNCEFSKGKSSYDVVAAYVDTEFNGCTFDSDFAVYAQATGFDFYFNDCVKNDEDVTRDEFKDQFPADSDVWTKCDTYVNGKLVNAVAEIVTDEKTLEFKSLQKALDAAHEMTGDVTVALVADVTEVAVVHQKEGLNLTVDGGGKTITGQLYVDGDGRYEGADTLTIKDAKFAYDADTYDDAFIDMPSTKTAGKPYTTGKYNYAHNVTVTGCEFAGEETTTVAVRVASGAGANKVVLSNNKVTGGHSFAQLVGVKDLTIEGNEVSGTKNGINISGGEGTGLIVGNTIVANASETEGYTVRMKDACGMDVELKDNTFSGAEGIINNTTGGGTITIESGKYAGPLPTDSAKFTVSGGVFSEKPDADVCATGLSPIANSDPETKDAYPWTVGQAIAKIGDVYYGSLVDAVAAAEADQKVELLTDASGAGIFVAANEGKNITIDLGAHTYTVTGPSVGSTGTATQGMHLEKGNTIKLTNGTLTSTADSGVLMLINNYCDLTLENVTLDGSNLPGATPYTLSNNNGAVAIGNGTTIIAKEGGIAFDVCSTKYYPDGAQVTVADGAVINGDIELGLWGPAPAENKATLTVNGGTINGKIVDNSGGRIAKKDVVLNDGTYANDPRETVDATYPLAKYPVKVGDVYEIQPSLDSPDIEVVFLSHEDETLTAAPTYTYTGSEIEPVVAVKVAQGINQQFKAAVLEAITDGALLLDGDYKVTYENNINKGTATATITATEQSLFAGTSTTRTFNISSAEITEPDVDLPDLTFNNGNQPVPLTVTVGGQTLTPGTDYTYTVNGANITEVMNAGTYTVVIEGKGNFTGRVETSFKVNPKDISDAELRDVTDKPFLGTNAAVTQDFKVFLEGFGTDGILSADTDYTVSYSERAQAGSVKPGVATLTVTGIGNYTGTVTQDFQIDGTSLSNAVVTIDPDEFVYDGTAKVPNTITVKLTDESEPLVAGTDYSISLYNNVNAGQAAIFVVGEGGFSGGQVIEFTIKPATITVDDIADQYVTGSAITPEVTVKANNEDVPVSDYTVNYVNNVVPGTATVTVIPNNNYTPTSVEKTFNIIGADKSNLEAAIVQAIDLMEDVEIINSADEAQNLPEGSKYIVKSDAIEAGYAEALGNAYAVDLKPTATQAEVDAATGALNEAIAATEPKIQIVAAYVAETGGVKYTTVAAAIEAAEAGATVTLLKDVTEDDLVVINGGKNLTLDLAGHTLTAELDVYDADVTIANGTLAGTVWANGSATDEAYGHVTIADDATIQSDYGVVIYQAAAGVGYGMTVDIYGTVNGIVWVMGNIHDLGSNPSTINVYDGAAITGDDVGIALNGAAVVNVEGGTITGTGTGIEVRAGKLNVSGGAIKGEGTPLEVNPNGNGTTTSGAGIAVAKHTTNLPIEVSVTGGSISGATAVVQSDPENNGEQGIIVTLEGGKFIAPDGSESVRSVYPSVVTIPEGSEAAFSDNSGETAATVPAGQYLAQGKDGLYRLAESTKIDVPTAVEGLTYNGSVQSGVNEGEGYTLADAMATDAGTHTATATLAEHYQWSDGTTDPKPVEWTIDKAEAVVVVDSFTKTYGTDDPTFTATVEGLFGEDTVFYTLKRAEGEAVGEHQITADTEENNNYNVTVEPGTLTITKGTILSIEAIADYLYTGNAIEPELVVKDALGKAVTADEGYTVTYLDNTQLGEAAVIVIGKDNYTGIAVAKFNIIESNKDALKEALDAADAARVATSDAEGFDLAAGTEYVTSAEQQALTDAIETAQAVYDDPAATDEQIATAAADLNDAVAAYKAVIETAEAAVAKIGDTHYTTLAAAIAAVPNDGTETTVELLADVAEETIAINGNRNIQLDLGGHELTADFMYVLNGALEVDNGTVNNRIYVYGLDTADSGMSSSLKVGEDATIKADYGIILDELGTKAAYDANIEIDGTVDGIVWVMGNIYEGNSTITVNEGASITGDDVGIALNGAAVVNVEGGTITGTGTGIEVRAGKLNVSGGAITGEGTPLEVNPNGNGTTSYGAGIAIAQHTTKLSIEVNVSGGTITGDTAIYQSDPQNNADADHVKATISGGTFIVEGGGTSVYSENQVIALTEDSAAAFSDDSAIEQKAVPEGKTLLQSEEDGLYRLADLYLTVRFDSDGGSEVDEQSVLYGNLADKPEDPTKDEMLFAGWTLNGEPFDFETPIKKNTELKATWTQAVARIDDTLFASLADAVAAAQDNDTITMITDEVIDAQVVVDKTITLDLNGKIISNEVGIWNNEAGVKSWSLMSVQGGDLTITGEGALRAKAMDCYALDVRAGGKLAIEDGTFVGNQTAVYVLEGSVDITGGDFSVIQKSNQGDDRFLINLYDSNRNNGTAKATITGGTFHGFDPSNNQAEGEGTDFTPEGYTGTLVEGETDVWTVKEQKQLAFIDYIEPQAYAGGEAIEPAFVVYDEYGEPVEAANYTFEFKDNTNAGNATLIVTAVDHGDYYGTVGTDFVIMAGKLGFELDAIDSVTYTGSAHTPAPTVDGEPIDTELYNVEYLNNVDAGTATVVVTAKDENIDDMAYVTFTIKKADIATTTITAPDQVADGTPKTIEGVKLGDYVLDTDDYSVVYLNNVGVGTATAILAGKGNFEGIVSVEFQITAPIVVVTFDSNGGSDVASQEISRGDTATEPEAPTKDGFVFAGWTLKGEPYDFTTEVTESITLVATWNEAVAQVGDQFFETFAEAAEAAAGTETITLLAKITEPYILDVDETLKVAKNGKSVTVKAPEGPYVVNSTTSDGVTTYTVAEAAVKYTAANGNVTYKPNLDYTNVSGSGTYQLLKDITAATRIVPGTMASDVTIDLNGHTLTSNATDCAILLSRPGSASKHKVLAIVDTSGEGGTLVVNPSANAAIEGSGKYNDITIGEGVTIDGGCVAILSENQTLTVDGTISGGSDFAVATNGIKTKNATITINEGATLTSDVTALYLPGGAAATVAGAVTGGVTGIEIRAGELNVEEGATITSTYADAPSSTANGNGITTSGAGIAIAQHTTKLPITVNVNGGTVEGPAAIYESNPQGNDSVASDVTVNLNDGTFLTTLDDGSAVYTEDNNVTIYGGAYSDDSDNTKAAVPEGKTLVQSEEDGLYRLDDLYLTVEFDTDGGTEVEEQHVLYKESASEPEAPTKDGFVFASWTLEGDPYDFTAEVTEDITLVATWTPAIQVPEATEGLVYNGTEQAGVPEGEGYTLADATATDAGTYIATATLDDPENTCWPDGTTDPIEVTFTIAPASDSQWTVEPIDTQDYTGKAVKPAVTVKVGDAVIPATDYVVTYVNNVEPGTATAIVVHKGGNLSGANMVDFQIVKTDEVDKTALAEAITKAEELGNALDDGELVESADGTDVPVGGKYITPEKLAEITDALAAAALVFTDENATQEQVDEATEALNKALENAIITKTGSEVLVPTATDHVYNGTEQIGLNDPTDGEQWKIGSGSVTAATDAGTYTATVELRDVINTTWQDGTTEPKTIEWNIKKATTDDWTVEPIADQTYTGEALEPAVKVKVGDEELPEDAYTVTYVNNTETGTAIVIVDPTDTDNMSGQKVVTFEIKAADLSTIDGLTISEIDDQTYTGEALEPAVTVKVGDKTLVEGTDYEVSYENNTAIGEDTAKVIVTGKGNYAGKVSETFSIVAPDKSELQEAVEEATSDKEATPTSEDGKDLKPGTEYVTPEAREALDDAIAAAQEVLENPNATQDDVEKATEAVKKAQDDFDNAKTTVPNPDKTELAAAVGVANKADDDLSKESPSADGSDVEPSEKYVTPEEQKALDDAIAAAQAVLDDPDATQNQIDEATKAVKKATEDYEAAKKPGKKIQKIAVPTGKTLTYNAAKQTGVAAGTGYTVTGNTATNVGSYTATATPKSGYAWKDGTTAAKKVTWKIEKASVKKAKVTLATTSYTYDGKAKKPAVKSVTLSLGGKTVTLKSGTDFTVGYKANTNAGTATVTVTGKGNFKDTATATFKIKPAKLTKIEVEYDQYFTGKAIKPAATVTSGKTKVAASGYTLSYTNNVKPGTAVATAVGKGNYTGTVTCNYLIHDKWERIAGPNAVGTMEAITNSDSVFTPEGVGTVVVAGRRDFKAALAGVGLAGLYKAPLLITEPANLSGPTKSELKRLKPSTVLVCGDTSVVSAAAFNAIKAAVPGAKVTRVSGSTPSATAVAIDKAGGSKWGKTAIVATQAAFKDALSIAPYAYAKHAPIFFTESTKMNDGKGLSSATVSAIKAGGFTRVLIVGGELAVPKSVETQLKGISCQRLAGANAIETSRVIAQFGLKSGMNRKHLAVATTQDFADALSGAALAGAQGSVLVLVNQSGGFGAFNAIYKPSELVHGHILGGPFAVSDANETYIRGK